MTARDQCVFCAILRGDEPAKILWRNPGGIVITPRHPVADGHALVIPRVHATDWLDSPHATNDAIVVALDYGRAKGIGDCNLITSRGPAATQTVYHLHLHIVPRRHGDGLALPWTGQGRDQP